MRKLMMLLLGCGAACLSVQAQSLLGNNPALPQIHATDMEWADYDGDGDPDLLLLGIDSLGAPRTVLARNDSNAFVQVSVPFSQTSFAAGAWGDSDGDGDPDLLLSGRVHGKGHTEYWRNDSTAGFAMLSSSLPGVLAGCVGWADLDGDGDQDGFIAGSNYDQGYVCIALQNQSGTLTPLSTSIPGFCNVEIALGDLSGDSLPEVLLSGRTMGPSPELGLFQNQGGFAFASTPPGLPAMPEGSVDLVDYDLDGDLDILATGGSRPLGLDVWRNDGGAFQRLDSMGLGGVAFGDARWLSFNGDSLPDFIYCGTDVNGQAVAKAMRQSAPGVFADHQSMDPLTGLHHACIAVADWDGDGHLDFALSGLNNSGEGVAMLYRWDATNGKFVL